MQIAEQFRKSGQRHAAAAEMNPLQNAAGEDEHKINRPTGGVFTSSFSRGA